MTTMTRSRTDIHRPSFLDPAEYREVGYADLHHEDGFCEMERGLGDVASFSGNFEQRGRCDHCGAGPLRYVVFFLHKPTDQIVSVGERCAGVLGLSSKTERQRRDEHAAARRQAQREAAVEACPAEIRMALQANEDAARPNYFLSDLYRKLYRSGYTLSERQIQAVRNTIDAQARRDAERAAETVATKPLAEGRYIIEGEVLSHKYQDTIYGTQHKMLIKMSDGNKVWGTVPASIEDALTHYDTDTVDELKGQTIRLAATVERSRDDDHFGFFKRPANATLTTNATPEEETA
jgi:hypothetical protein